MDELREMLSPEQQAALDRVRAALAQQALVPGEPGMPFEPRTEAVDGV